MGLGLKGKSVRQLKRLYVQQQASWFVCGAPFALFVHWGTFDAWTNLRLTLKREADPAGLEAKIFKQRPARYGIPQNNLLKGALEGPTGVVMAKRSFEGGPQDRWALRPLQKLLNLAGTQGGQRFVLSKDCSMPTLIAMGASLDGRILTRTAISELAEETSTPEQQIGMVCSSLPQNRLVQAAESPAIYLARTLETYIHQLEDRENTSACSEEECNQ